MNYRYLEINMPSSNQHWEMDETCLTNVIIEQEDFKVWATKNRKQLMTNNPEDVNTLQTLKQLMTYDATKHSKEIFCEN